MALNYCGYVDSEDGFLLLGDATTLQLWRGSDNEDSLISSIESAVQLKLPGFKVPILHKSAIMWDIEGPGTADIFYDETLGKILIVRSWLPDPETVQLIYDMSAMHAELNYDFAEFEVNTGTLAIICPIESGSCIQSTNGIDFYLAPQEMMTESSGILLPIANGRYKCYHDDVEMEQSEARRCHIVKI